MNRPTTAAAQAMVVLLHGMALPARVMRPLARYLERAGYRTRIIDYPTRPYDVAGLVDRYLRPVLAASGDDRPVHVVAHSLGGILVRYYLQAAELPAGSRIVMLVPPNQGSETADLVRRWPIYRWLMGAVGQQLGTGPDGIVHRLRPIAAEVGVIAARRSLQPWFSRVIPGENDGAVSVASTRLAEMRDFLVGDSSHTLILFNRDVHRQVRQFLAHGRFRH